MTNTNFSQRAGAYRVLIIGEDLKQNELCADLIREVEDCQINVISRVESPDWGARLNYHLIVIDASRSPGNPDGIPGLRLLESIKRISPVTSVILISDSANVEDAVSAIRLGAEDYLKRPFNLEAFQLAVKRGLDRKTVFGENGGASSYLGLLNACQMISAVLEQDRIFGVVQSYLSRELRSNHSALYKLEKDVVTRFTDSTQEPDGDRAMEEILDIALHASNPLPRMAEDGEMSRFIERGQLTPGLFIFRFQCVGDTQYFCVCLSPARPVSPELFESQLRMLRAQIAVTGKNIEQYMGVQHLVYVDEATGLYNTRYLNNILDREIMQAQQTGKSFAILFIDADRFKSVNDKHGHMVGTKLLNELGSELRKLVRDTDTCFRYGGDEFVAVLSACDLKTAQVVAERIRKSVEVRSFLASENLNIHFTVSIGVALFPDHADSKRTVIEAADHAMYNAKRSTRNSVFIADLNQIAAAKDASGTETHHVSPVDPSDLPTAAESVAKIKPIRRSGG